MSLLRSLDPLSVQALSRRRWLAAAAALPVLAVAGCASAPKPGDYTAEKPVLDLKQYFNGKLIAHGVFTDRGGKVVRRFVVDMTCTWTGENGVLDEQFRYSDGKTERRVWRLTHQGDGRYIGRADDVVGTAQGQTSGNSFYWTYTLRLPVGERTFDVQFEDWMWLVDERVMLNKAVMSKFGIYLGEVTLSFTKL
jgi:hypothetical protein